MCFTGESCRWRERCGVSSYESGVRGPEHTHKHISVDERPPPLHSTGFVDSDLPCGQLKLCLVGRLLI